MQQMCKIGNRGSATIELSIIMPLILLIIVMIIKLYIGLIYEGNVCGSSYSSLYTYEISETGKGSEKLETLNQELEKISDTGLAYEDDRHKLSAAASDGNINVVSVAGSGTVTYKTEYDKCSSRLRRWQLYGDVIR
jgi:uncharacterized protein (UPF0333 family)